MLIVGQYNQSKAHSPKSTKIICLYHLAHTLIIFLVYSHAQNSQTSFRKESIFVDKMPASDRFIHASASHLKDVKDKKGAIVLLHTIRSNRSNNLLHNDTS